MRRVIQWEALVILGGSGRRDYRERGEVTVIERLKRNKETGADGAETSSIAANRRG